MRGLEESNSPKSAPHASLPLIARSTHPKLSPASAALWKTAPVEILSRGNSVEIVAAHRKQSENKFFQIGI
jgi:hypothetical protein